MKYLNYILIIVGAFVAMYAKVGVDQNQYILIGGQSVHTLDKQAKIKITAFVKALDNGKRLFVYKN